MGYVRNNYGCHCFYGDSAFKRYNRAHCGDTVIFNYNSGNTYNACCGGHRGGGFWGGIGMGLGMGLGNLFGGLFGGMFNGGGMFGGLGNMFGMGGMSPFGGFGNFGGGLWGLGGGTGAAGGAGAAGAQDKDNAKINKLDDKADKLIAKVKAGLNDKTMKPEEAAKQIDDLIDKLENYEKLDKLNTKANDEQIKIIIDRLKKAKDDLGLKSDNDTKPNDANNNGGDVDPANGNAGNNTPTPGNAPVAGGNEGDTPVDDTPGTETNPSGGTQPSGNGGYTYENGYTNYDPEKDGALNDGDVIRAHDCSGATRDTVQGAKKAKSTITKSSNGNHPQTIVIHDTKDITYTYKETKDGEYLYESDQDHQIYVLQKNSNGKYDLMQYKHHKGYNKRDWS